MTSDGGADGRQHPRAPIACRVRLVVENQADFKAKFANNISEGGVFVASSGELPVGSKVAVEISLKTGAYLVRAMGEVVRVEKADKAAGHKVGGLAIKFLDMDPESRERIQEIVERNLPAEEIKPEHTDREADNRDHHRAPVSRKIRFVADTFDDVIGAVIKNISEGGMFAETARPPELDSEVEVEFALKNGERLLTATARVAWLRSAEQAKKQGYPPGCGLEFNELQAGDRDEIKDLVVQWRKERGHVASLAPEHARDVMDQRKFARIPLTRKIRIVADSIDEVVQAVSRDIGEGGMFVSTDRPPPTGSEIEVEFSLRDGEPVLKAKTKVIWVRPPDPTGKGDQQSGCGLKFVALEANNGAEIRKLVQDFDTAQAHARPTKEIPASDGEIPLATPPPADAAVTESETRPVESPLPETPPPITAESLAPRPGPPAMPSGEQPQNIGLDIGHGVPRAAAVEHTSVRVITPKAEGADLAGTERLIGRKCRSRAVDSISEAMGLQVQPDARREVAVVVGDREAPVEELVAASLGGVRKMVGDKLGTEPTRVWMAVPGHFNPEQRRALRTAAQRAGFSQVRLINASAAAAVAYAFNRNREELALVYELGGRGFEAALVQITGNAIEIIARTGDPLLSTDELDTIVREHLRSALAEAAGGPLPADDAALDHELHVEAAHAVLELCGAERSEVKQERFTRIGGKEVGLQATLERSLLDAVASKLVTRTLEHCDALLVEAEKQKTDVQSLLMLGTHGRLPAIRDAVAAHIGHEPESAIDPERSVAIGAALIADAAERVDTIMIREVCGQSIGVGLPRGAFEALIPRNARLPWSERRMIGAARSSRTTLEVHLFHAGSYEGMFHEYLTSFVLPAARATGGPLYELTLGVDEEGLLKVEARDLESGDPISLGPAAPADPEEVLSRLGAR